MRTDQFDSLCISVFKTNKSPGTTLYITLISKTGRKQSAVALTSDQFHDLENNINEKIRRRKRNRPKFQIIKSDGESAENLGLTDSSEKSISNKNECC